MKKRSWWSIFDLDLVFMVYWLWKLYILILHLTPFINNYIDMCLSHESLVMLTSWVKKRLWDNLTLTYFSWLIILLQYFSRTVGLEWWKLGNAYIWSGQVTATLIFDHDQCFMLHWLCKISSELQGLMSWNLEMMLISEGRWPSAFMITWPWPTFHCSLT